MAFDFLCVAYAGVGYAAYACKYKTLNPYASIPQGSTHLSCACVGLQGPFIYEYRIHIPIPIDMSTPQSVYIYIDTYIYIYVYVRCVVCVYIYIYIYICV